MASQNYYFKFLYLTSGVAKKLWILNGVATEKSLRNTDIKDGILSSSDYIHIISTME